MIIINGDKLRKYRKEEGYSQQELGKLLEVDASAISKYESGEREPRPKVREKIVILFGQDAATDIFLNANWLYVI